MELSEIVQKTRKAYNIPPYVDDDVLAQYADAGRGFFLSLAGCDIDEDTDTRYQTLLMSYIYYWWSGVGDAFIPSYAQDLVAWQSMLRVAQLPESLDTATREADNV